MSLIVYSVIRSCEKKKNIPTILFLTTLVSSVCFLLKQLFRFDGMVLVPP